MHGKRDLVGRSVIDDDVPRQILDEYYRLPKTLNEGIDALHRRFADQGLQIVVNIDGIQRPAHPRN